MNNGNRLAGATGAGADFLMNGMKEDQKSPEQSAVVERTCRILHELGRCGRGGARLVDLTNGTSLTRPAALRILRTLASEGLVEQREDRRYFLGPAIYQMGLAAPSPLGDLEPFRAIIRELAAKVGDTAYLSMRQGDHAYYLLREEGAFPVRTHLVQVGDAKPLTHTYGGLTILSCMRPDEAAVILNRLMPQVDVIARQRRATIERMLKRAREVRYVSGPDLVIRGVAGLGLPVLGRTGAPFLAVTVSAITSRLEDGRLEEVRNLVAEAVTKIQELL